ncbi:MAG: arsenate reductase ArsC [Planctomycetota bacterium]|nr:arsenate reductase ArsC [Planctomycetota bacterium]
MGIETPLKEDGAVESGKRVLFLCTGNSCRSQMAEGYLRHLGGNRFWVASAGLEPRPLHPLAVQVMAEDGVDISRQRSKSVKEYLGRMRFDTVIVVCDHAQENCPALWPGTTERLFWPFPDPAAAEGSEAERIAKFREVRDAIKQKIKEWLA